MDSFRQKFIEEAQEFLNELENVSLALESAPEDPGLIEQIFRIMHTLKGNSAMFGFPKIDALTHQLETIYDLIRNNRLVISKELLDLTLESVDHIGNLLNEDDQDPGVLMRTQGELLHRIEEVVRAEAGNNQVFDTSDDQAEEKGTDLKGIQTYYINFQPDPEMLHDGSNPLYLVDDFHQLGDCMVFPNRSSIPALEDLDPEKCYFGWEIILATDKGIDAIHEIFIFSSDDCELLIEKLADFNLLKVDRITEKVDPIFRDGTVDRLENLKKLAESYADSGKEKKDSAILKTNTQPAKNAISSIRVSSEKLDELMNLVSELVTNQASLTLLSEQSNLPDIISIAENMEKISRQLRENTFNICLIPIDTIMTRFHRLVRDLSSELGKEVEFLTEGTETELDKNIIESLSDPIMHILRNSLDHGIENAESRKIKDKTERGRIVLKAFYSGMNVYIQIQDDGAGIDPENIRRKAISRGLIPPETDLSKKEVFDLLFLPGFSTAEKVTDVSGRGVGMDVVNRKIEDLRGEVEIDSRVDEGTTITIKLPLTLSIIDGMLVKVNNTHFVIQLSVVDKVHQVRTADLVENTNGLISLNGELIPYLYLRTEFDVQGDVPEYSKMIVVKYDNKQVGLSVDDIIGEYQAVLKPLGKLFQKQEKVSGATILGDGSVALVLDTNKIIDQIAVVDQAVPQL